MLIAALTLAAAALLAPHPADEWLIARSQALLDAVATGDRKVWSDTLAPSAVLTDEDGHVRSASEAIAAIQPLPPGFSGTIRISAPVVRWSGAIGVLTYDALEDEDIHGQRLHNRFHTTDVYAPLAGAWRIVASQTSVLPAEAKPLGKPGELAEYAGSYEQGGRRVEIRVAGGALVSQRAGGAAEPLTALGGDYFARAGRPRELRIFIRSADGHVTSFADRRDNVDLIWERVPQGSAQKQ